MRLPRLTTRRLMVLVAAVAVLLTAGLLARRSAEYRTLAAMHARDTRRWVAIAGTLEGVLEAVKMRSGVQDEWTERSWRRIDDSIERIIEREKEARLRTDYHARLDQKYRRAADRPWLPVPPDLPMPK